jgi:hypothetical protein
MIDMQSLDRRVRRLGAVAALGLSLLATPLLAKDCGRMPVGKNPAPDEIGKAMEVFSARYSVPTEVLKGIAFQESGVQQWRADGSFVHNVTDCGLGMMQLTGSTAEQFDVEKLKDDWKYNLECGVKVLVQKWDRAQREGKVTADPADKKIIENWYYPIAYYWGGKGDGYVTKIFDHVRKRPGVLAKLLSRAVDVTLPGSAIKGWSHGKKFHAEAGDRWQDEAGTVFKAPTHVGTIGDPDTLAELELLLARARKAIKANQTGQAVSFLAKACANELELEPRVAARKLLDELEKTGAQDLADAEVRAAGDREGALKVMQRLAQDFAPVALGKKAKERAAALAKEAGGAGSEPQVGEPQVGGPASGPAPTPTKEPAPAPEPTPPPSSDQE